MSATLMGAWLATVGREPSAPAVITVADGRAWSREQLAATATAWCAAKPAPAELACRRVALAVPNGMEWWQAFLGLLSMEAVPVLVDVSEPQQRRVEIARSVGAAALWTEGQWLPLATSRRREGREVALVKLTSGSTGEPRAWPFTHVQMLADGRQVCAAMGIRPTDLNFAAIPFGHSYGLGNLVVPLLDQGTPVLCADSPLPSALAAACARWQPTVFPAVPALLDALVRSEASPEKLGSLRLVISAGAALPPPLASAFAKKFQCMVHNFYGASETGGICYDQTGESTLSGRSVGTPLQGVVLRWGRGRRFQVTSPAVCRKGGFSPADRGRLNASGELVLLGRAGRTVKVGARRVDLGEIETALRAVAGVHDAYASADPARPGTIAAVVASTTLASAAIRAALLEQISSWKLPHRLHVLPALPLTVRGKVDIKALHRQMFG